MTPESKAIGPHTGQILGVDLSLTGSGLATADRAWTVAGRRGETGLARLISITATVRNAINDDDIGLVVIEGPSYGSRGGLEHERGGLWWMVCEVVYHCGVELAVAPPATVKKYATGRGNSDKDAMMLATARRFAWFDGDNNAADALWLCALGYAVQGAPLLKLPAAHLTAVAAVKAWPFQLPGQVPGRGDTS